MALTDINNGYFTKAQYEMFRLLYQNGEMSRKEFLDYLPAYVDSSMIDEKGYIIPATPASIEIPEPINNRFEILDL